MRGCNWKLIAFPTNVKTGTIIRVAEMMNLNTEEISRKEDYKKSNIDQ
jgi:hypothetical protein